MSFKHPSRRAMLHGIAAGVALAPVAAAAASSRSQRPSSLPHRSLTVVEAEMARLVATGSLPSVSAAVGMANGTRWSHAAGLADMENSALATPQTLYRTASIAKWMTATATLHLVERGLLRLDDKVGTVCPVLAGTPVAAATVAQLLGHTSGIRSYHGENLEPRATTEEKRALAALIDAERLRMYRHYDNMTDPVATFAHDPLIFTSGTRQYYTSLGYRALGCVLEHITGSYRALMREAVFAPAQMVSTTDDDAARIIRHRAAGYNRGVLEDPPSPAAFDRYGKTIRRAEFRDVSENLPAGGYLSTASDLVEFALAFRSGKLVSEQSRALMLARLDAPSFSGGPVSSSHYGFGVRVDNGDLTKAAGGRHVLSHDGGQDGTSTVLALLPDQGIAVAVMTNLGGGDDEVYAILKQLLSVLTSTAPA